MIYSAKEKERFQGCYDKGKTDECWEWKNGCGQYGFFYMKRNGLWPTFLAHRVAWEIANNMSIKSERKNMICHTCDNKRCVNPNHLYLGTGVNNNRDTISRHPNQGNRKKGNDCSWTKILDEELIDIIESTETQNVLAERYKVSQSAISRIKTGERKRVALR